MCWEVSCNAVDVQRASSCPHYDRVTGGKIPHGAARSYYALWSTGRWWTDSFRFPPDDLDAEWVDRLAGSGRDVEDLYPLSPCSRGILFHALREEGSGVCVEQPDIPCRGRALSATFAAAWQQLMQRHPILRGGFIWEGLDEPLQRVQREAATPWAEYDLREAACTDPQQRLSTFLRADRLRGFDLTKPPLLRMTLFRLNEHAYQIVWTFHHLLLDGWSPPLLLRDLVILYVAASQGQEARLGPTRPFRDYIAWLQSPGPGASRVLLARGTARLPCPTRLPLRAEGLKPGPAPSRSMRAELPVATHRAVEELARTQGLRSRRFCRGLGAAAQPLQRRSGCRVRPDSVRGARRDWRDRMTWWDCSSIRCRYARACPRIHRSPIGCAICKPDKSRSFLIPLLRWPTCSDG